jgi:hypothetical protein
MTTYWLIEAFLISWMILIILLGQKLVKQYPIGQSYKQAELKQLKSVFLVVISLIVFTLLYFSSWLANWTKHLAMAFPTDDQLADLGSICILTSVSIVITFIFIQQKKQLSYYRQMSGLTDFLPASSLAVLKSLSITKQRAITQRLQWAIATLEQNGNIELTILFDKEDLKLLEEIFSVQDQDLDPRLTPIYQQINRLTSNRPFRIIL